MPQMILAIIMVVLFLAGLVFLLFGKKRIALLLVGTAIGLVLLSKIVLQM